ncbi:MAG TPA: hypothetical protein VF627_00845 [Abditibacterium sp.]|jgi:hypothetical protein
MPNNDEEFGFPDDIRAAFDDYPQPRPSPDFEAQFWSSLDARRGRYRGFAGFLRRLWEVEIEGVAVWPTLGQLVEQCGAAALLGFIAACLCFGLWRLSPSSLPPSLPPQGASAARRTTLVEAVPDPFSESLPFSRRDSFGAQF